MCARAEDRNTKGGGPARHNFGASCRRRAGCSLLPQPRQGHWPAVPGLRAADLRGLHDECARRPPVPAVPGEAPAGQLQGGADAPSGGGTGVRRRRAAGGGPRLAGDGRLSREEPLQRLVGKINRGHLSRIPRYFRYRIGLRNCWPYQPRRGWSRKSSMEGPPILSRDLSYSIFGNRPYAHRAGRVMA